MINLKYYCNSNIDVKLVVLNILKIFILLLDQGLLICFGRLRMTEHIFISTLSGVTTLDVTWFGSWWCHPLEIKNQ